MPKITPGNRLYLYQLLSREIGVGRQTLLPRVEEALAGDGLVPGDLGCADMRSLCEELPEFIKLTVFKKGYVYATVLPNEEYDRALERASSEGAQGKGAPAGKPWKRRRGAKALKPVKPRHVEPEPEPAPATTEPEPAVTEVEPTAAKPAVEVEAPTPEPADGAEKNEPVAEGAAEADAPEVIAAEAVTGDAAPEDATSPAVEGAVEDTPEKDMSEVPAAEESEATEVPVVEAPVAPEAAPSITLTITYVPEPEPEAEPEFEQSHEADPVVDDPRPVVPASRAQADLPRDFHAEVRCSSEQLSTLYQVLPENVDPLATLEEDFRVARSTGAIEGTRSNVTFSLRYLQADGVTPVRVTLRRSARPVAGKRWALTDVDAGTPEEVGLEGLSAAPSGPWAAFLAQAPDVEDPGLAFAQTVEIGSWEEALEGLASLARPEDWGTGRHVLRDYLAMSFSRIRAEGKLAVSDDGGRAAFDTGLLSGEGLPIVARLVSLPGDIPWQLEGFSTEVDPRFRAEPALYVTRLSQITADPALALPDEVDVTALRRSPRLATPAYDPALDRVLLLVPHDGRALALAPSEGAYAPVASLSLGDAYACARVVSGDLPSWLSAGLE